MFIKIKEFSYQNHILFFLLWFLPFFSNLPIPVLAQSNFATVSDYDPNKVNVLVFPGAEGFGRHTTGGRGGQVIKVTNLNDSGPGSLREALDQRGSRIIVFDVSGNINLKSRLNVYHGDLTIAGQTAPGDGITLTNYSLYLRANNVIIRFLRFRLGDLITTADDPIQGIFQKNIIIDHCSMSWGRDETASFYANENFTLQWSIISEGLNNSIQTEHGYGGLWGGKNASFHHNLIAHFTQRSPAFDNLSLFASESEAIANRGVVDFRNNVVYNWRNRSIDGGEKGTYNVVNNYFKPGPATGNGYYFLYPTGSPGNYGKYFVSGNILENNSNVNSDNWKGVRLETTPLTEQYLESTKLFTALPSDVYEYNHNAQDAYQKTLNFAGASLVRDAVDVRIVNETRNKTFTFNGSNGSKLGIIDSQKDVGGWPTLKSTPAPIDTDGDGIPDSWESANNLNPTVTNDREYNLNPYYTDIEVYINSLVQPIINQTNPGVPNPVKLLLPSPSSTISPVEASFSWAPVSNATSFRLQISKSIDFSTNVITLDNLNYLSFIRNQLDPSTTYYWRVRASNDFGSGPYSSIGTFKTSTLNVVPDAPLLLKPSNNATGIAIKPELTWSRVPNSTSYRLQISTVSSFSSFVTDQSNLSGTTFSPSNLQENTLYYWRVRASNETGNGSYSQVGSFKTVSFDVIPEVTILTRPAHNTIINPVSIKLEWEPNPTAEFYTLQLSTSSDFSLTSNFIINKSGITDTYFFIESLNSNSTYHWRIRASNRKGTDYYSKPFSFKTTAFTEPPSEVELISPVNDSNIFSTSIKFSWEDTYAKSYRLQVSTSSNFSDFVANVSGITAASYTVSNLIRNTQYYWRIIPVNEAGSGNPSVIWKVRSATTSSTISAPKQKSPLDKSIIPSNNIVFNWENQPNSALYRIQISNKSDFSNLIVNVSNIQGPTYQVAKLTDNTTYFWRVRGYTGTVYGSYSSVWSFKTGTQSVNSDLVVLLSPKNNEIDQSYSLPISWQAYPNASSYLVEVSESGNFSTMVVNQLGVTSTSYALNLLKPATKYFWRITPYVNNVKGIPSEVWNFTTESLPLNLDPTSAHLVGHWKMDEGSGNTLFDQSGNGNDAVLQNTSGVTWTTGIEGLNLNLPGTLDRLAIAPHKSSLNVTQAITISAWIRPLDLHSRRIISKKSTVGFEFGISSLGKIEFIIQNSSTILLRSNTSFPTDGNTWMHVAATFNGTTSTIYINGEPDATTSHELVSIGANTSGVYIGSVLGNNRWRGGLDDLRLYNIALSHSQIRELLSSNQRINSILPSSLDLVGHWKMDENTGNILIDHSGKGNNAILQNVSGVSWTQGIQDFSLSLPGTINRFAMAPHSESINIESAITISAWIRPNSIHTRRVISKTGPNGYELGTSSLGKIEFKLNGSSFGNKYTISSETNYPIDGKTWMHVAATFDGTTSSIYINGKLDKSISHALFTIGSNTSALYIGALLGNNRWDGAIDDLRLYKRALGASEILNLHSGESINARQAGLKTDIVENTIGNILEEPQDSRFSFQIYPNPVEDKLTIQMNESDEGRITLTIYDIMGRMYINKTVDLTEGKIILELEEANMASGLYILILDQGQIGMRKVKFLKK